MNKYLYHYAHPELIDRIQSEGILNSESLLHSPELFNHIASKFNQNPKKWKQSINKRLKGWHPWAVQGVSTMFSPIPEGVELNKDHPVSKHKMQLLKINLTRMLKDNPNLKLHGSELTPYGEHSKIEDRHRDLTTKEIDSYRRTDPKKLWQHYKPKDTLYAGDVPHAFVPGNIAPKYIKTAADEHTTSHTKTMPNKSIVDVVKLWSLTAKNKVHLLPLSEIENPKKNPGTGYSDKRKEKANVSHPLLLHKDKWLIDGRHRYWKHTELGNKDVPARYVTQGQINKATI